MPRLHIPYDPDPERKLRRLLSHAAVHSPWYREQAWAERVRHGAAASLTDIPVTPAAALRLENRAFFADRVPQIEGAVTSKFTSGSTGEPVEVRRTALQSQANMAENTRLKAAWRMDRLHGLLDIRLPKKAGQEALVDEQRLPNGSPFWTVYSVSSDDVARVFDDVRPNILRGYPSIVLAALRQIERAPFLKLVQTVGETIPPELEEKLKRFTSCRHMDSYGSVETGLIACRCARCGRYHVADGQLIVELLDGNDRSARPGTLGRVVVTVLLAMAMPLVRYDIGDLAIVGGENRCRKGNGSIQRIAGRIKSIFRTSGGTMIAPMIAAKSAAALDLERYKLLQTSLDHVEFLYKTRDGVPDITDHVAQKLVDQSMGRHFRGTATRVDDFPAAPSGKYVMHEGLVS